MKQTRHVSKVEMLNAPRGMPEGLFDAKINATAGKALAPCLAIVMLAPIIFSSAQYYFAASHPSWIFWVMLTASCLMAAALRHSRTSPNAIDFLMIAFLLMIFASASFNMIEGDSTATREIVFFVMIPYTAGRLLTVQELKLFFRVSGFVTLSGMVVAIGGMLELGDSEFMTDRIKTLFAVVDMHGVVLLGGGVIPQLSLATGWLALMSIHYPIDKSATKSKATNICLCLAVFSISIYLLFLAGLRGKVVAVLATCVFLAAIGRSSIRQKTLVILFIVATSVLSYCSLGTDRADHYKKIAGAAKSSFRHYKDIGNNPEDGTDNAEPGDSCKVKSDGIATRLLLIEKTKALIHEFPWFGVGVGRWGIITECGAPLGSPHNFILHAAAELGLTGALVAAFMIMMALIKILVLMRNADHRHLRLGVVSTSLLIFLLIQSQFSGNYLTDFQLYAMLGIISGLATSRKQGSKDVAEYEKTHYDFVK